MEPNNTEDIFNKRIGNIDQVKKTLSEKIVTILGYSKQTEKSNGDKMQVPLVKILVKHPDKEDPVSISKIKVLMKDKIVTKSLWVQLDADGNIQKSSAIDDLLRYLNIETISETTNKSIDTIVESEDSNFLCLKAY